MSKFFLDTKKIDKIYKNELKTFRYYKNTVLKHYACLYPKYDEPLKFEDYYMPFSFILDPILHLTKLIINCARLIPAFIELILSTFNVKGCKASTFGNVLAAMCVNLVNLVISPFVGLFRLVIAIPYGMITKNLQEATSSQANGEHKAEENHIHNKLDILNDTDNYQEYPTTNFGRYY